MKYLVFVDFDGVLTTSRVHFAQYTYKEKYPMWAKFDPVVVDFFNKIHLTFEDVSFVWTTTWRNGMTDYKTPMAGHWAQAMWDNAGFLGKFGSPWRVNPDEHIPLNQRAREIKHYLETYGEETKDYIIFDDTDYGFNRELDKRRFVQTHPSEGMRYKDMKDAWAITGMWDKK